MPATGNQITLEKHYLTDQEAEEEMRCVCERFPDNPCDNEFTSVDFLCEECRPSCPCGTRQAALGCFKAQACRLVPALGSDMMIHYRES